MNLYNAPLSRYIDGYSTRCGHHDDKGEIEIDNESKAAAGAISDSDSDSSAGSSVVINIANKAINDCSNTGGSGSNGNGNGGNGGQEDPVDGFTVALQASASESQCFESEDEPTKVLMDTLDYSVGDIELDDSTVIVGEAGSYFVIAAPQVGWCPKGCEETIAPSVLTPAKEVPAEEGEEGEEGEDKPVKSGDDPEPKNGDDTFRCWIRVNGENVPNSNVLMQVKSFTKDVIVTQGIIPLEADDEVEVYAAVSDDKVLLEAIDNEGEPLVPAIIFSIYKVN